MGIKDFIKKRATQVVEGVKKDYRTNQQIKAAEKAAYDESRKTQAIRFGQERAKIEANRRLERIKNPPSFGNTGFGGPGMAGLGNTFGTPMKPAKKKKKGGGMFDLL